ncbi:MAG: T9SS type A sorting domain-containing protein [Bacteroidetes bacterium]|nr:T9SS type A sorting domain-containing protein [Bacteroidota bacterium]
MMKKLLKQEISKPIEREELMNTLLKILLTGLLSTVLTFTHGQEWPKIYGGNTSSYVRGIENDYDNGYLIAGYLSRGQVVNQWGWLIKTDINGNIIWEKKFGDLLYQTFFYASQKTKDHGTVLAASTSKNDLNGHFNPLFIKLNPCGEIDWCLELQASDDDYGTGMVQLVDGNYLGMMAYYAGYSHNQRISLVKIDTLGNPIWIKNYSWDYPQMSNEEGSHLLVTHQGHNLVSGRCTYPGFRPFWFMTDTSGQQTWDLIWGNYTGWLPQTVEKDTGIFYSAGTYGNQTCFHPSIFKLNESGQFLSQYYLLGDTIVAGGASSIEVLNDSSLIVGIAWTNVEYPVDEGYSNVLITDTAGNISKIRLLIDDPQGPKCIKKTFDDKILVTGTFNPVHIYLWKLNSDLEDDTLYTQPFTYDSLCPYPISSDTTDLSCGVYVSIDEIPLKEEYDKVLKIYPNPVASIINFEFKDLKNGAILSIYDSYGKLAEERAVPAYTKETQVDVMGFKPGLYLAVLKNSKTILGKERFMVVR